jgi:hypothetical protein
MDSGAYDLTQILPPSAPLVRDDELWFYYTGLKYRASFDYIGKFPDREYRRKQGLEDDHGAVCLAVLRRDGFLSLTATEEEGSVETRRFRWPTGRMFVNVDARQGRLRVEVLDPTGEVVARSAPIVADTPKKELTWESSDLATWVGKEVSLRFVLTETSVYSYWFE